MAAPGHDAVVLQEEAANAFLETTATQFTSRRRPWSVPAAHAIATAGLAGMVDQGWRLVSPGEVDRLWGLVADLRSVSVLGNDDLQEIRDVMESVETALCKLVKGHAR